MGEEREVDGVKPAKGARSKTKNETVASAIESDAALSLAAPSAEAEASWRAQRLGEDEIIAGLRAPAYRVRLAGFEGPLDLLLYLIKRDEIDIFHIPIARLTEGLPMTRQAVTKHLRIMESAGLVRSSAQGHERLWHIEERRLQLAQRHLDTIAREWDARLARLEKFVSATR